ncbi:MAG: hypothetical protein ACLFQ1_12265, partial [Halochromatium sp.]|uniref:hypothetical protein n=2 Tax=Halochromatium sp. TaxID=2049430 RepID=UPI00397AFC63
GESWIIDDLVFDDRDWALAYLDLSMGWPSTTAAADPHGSVHPCLVSRQSIDWLDPAEETLHLAVGAQELRTASAMPSPVAFDERAQVRVYEPA